jgi:hypothetical protein
MNTIPVFFENIDRSALIVTPKQPFIDWLLGLDPTINKVDVTNDPDVYLKPDFDNDTQVVKWLERNFDDIFRDQLNHWYNDESKWIQKRTFKVFKEWFNYSIHTMIWDTLENPIEKI